MLSSSSQNMSNNSSYSNDRGSSFETEYAVDPASGGFFHSDFKKHDDLKEMLDSNKDSLKLEAMKRIIGMVAKGRDASILFPAVVKNVVSKNIEVKKLVYVYLERYAEEQQDLALLSISTFQRALKEPNQLIRAGALRVLSSVRVKMISPIVMLAIRDASSDMSPYVRKTAAHAIPKLYSLDPELKSELVTIIQKLLADKTVLVIGSAVMAFTEVCPERVDLIHQVYRKLCALLVDVDEWGQVTIVNMLTRYARTQFVNPNLREQDSDCEFYDSGSDSSEKPPASLDPDHRLLLRSTRPLLQSRNAAVVMAVAQLYHHASPKSESPLAAKALVRLLRSHVEVQSVVLNAIASISAKNKGMFEPYLKSFFVRTSDPTNVKLLKLEILTNLTTGSNVSIILRELQTYISNSDKHFVAATIQAIGRCACCISEVTDSCLSGLVSLLSNRDEAVVAESVVVIKKLLQTQTADPKEIITHMARLLDSITVAQARAAILWLLGEHSQKVVLYCIAPDILRKMAKTFSDENDIVKLQVMNLAIKLYITNPEQTALLCQYIFNLARYDQNYDIRDKARLLKQFVPGQEGKIKSQAARIFLANKPAPLLQSQFRDHEDLQLGSLSHYIKQRANGYEPLPPFPEISPPGEVRNVEPIVGEDAAKLYKNSDKKGKDMFLWESEPSSAANSSSSDSSSSESSSEASSGSEEESSEEESSEEEESENDYISTRENDMEHQAGPSGLGRSADRKLALTEENLNYFLRQEYTLSQMCYDADQMTLEVLNEMNRPQSSTENPNHSNDQQLKQQYISVEKMVVGQEDDSDFTLPKGPVDENNEDKNVNMDFTLPKGSIDESNEEKNVNMDFTLPKGFLDENNEDKNVNMDFTLPKGSVDESNEDKNVNMESLKDIFKLDVDAPGLISLFNFCQTEYGENADWMWKENLQEVWRLWQAKKALDENLAASTSTQVDSEDVAMDVGKVSRESVCFKINNMNDSVSTDSSTPFNVNYLINGKIKIDYWKNVNVIKNFVNEEEMEIPKESLISASKNNGTYQVQSSTISSTQLKELGGLNTASIHMTSTQNDGLFAKKNTNGISSVRDLALASCSSHDIEYIDADEDCFESPMSEITYYKTDSEDSKKNKTLSSINKTRGHMIDLEDLLNTFKKSTNLHIRNLNFENVVPAKSSLKRKISQISNKKKVKMSGLKFTSVTIFYFERSQGFSSIPTKGGSTLGMENQHFYISTIPIDEYEHRKVQKQHSNLRSSSIICHRKANSREKPKNVQALTLSQRIELLESAEVRIEGKEEVDCAHIRSSRASAGCDCKEYCDPEVCCCSLAGIECQVDRPNFPCGCSRENCRNRMGRNEYNHSKVRTHFTKTMRKINYENKGRTSKRKQASPTKVIMRNPDITRDINVIQI